MREKQKENGYIVAKAVFKGEQVKKLAGEEEPVVLRSVGAVFPGFPANFFVGYRPRHIGDWKRQSK